MHMSHAGSFIFADFVEGVALCADTAPEQPIDTYERALDLIWQGIFDAYRQKRAEGESRVEAIVHIRASLIKRCKAEILHQQALAAARAKEPPQEVTEV